MVAVFFKHQNELDECVEKINALGGLISTSSTDFNVEIIAKGASKGDGIRRLAKMLDISTDEIIGVGDSRNDIALLEAVGLPLAVSNAADVLKEKAEAVICHHTEHVVKYILENTSTKAISSATSFRRPFTSAAAAASNCARRARVS